MRGKTTPNLLLRTALIATLTWICLGDVVLAELTLPSFFSDHMVLQRDKPAPVWGWADPGAKIAVLFADRSYTTTANDKGDWRVELGPLSASEKGSELKIKAGSDRVTIADVLVGEVWFASGQSNMMFSVRGSQHAAEDIAAADYPGLRMFLADMTPASTPQSNIGGQWKLTTPKTVGSFSAVAYFFALHLHKVLGIPIGVIRSAWGGKPCETFTSRKALATVPYGQAMLDQLKADAEAYDPEKATQRYERAMAKWKTDVAAARQANRGQSAKERKRLPRRPAAPRNPLEKEGRPGVLYNGMIHPFVGYGMRGAIWYQGEANAKPGKAEEYKVMFPLMIRDWRARWGEPFSYYWVQLANFKQPTTEPGAVSPWAVVQNAQRLTLSLPNTGMAVINDIGEARNIHPKNKRTVGKRLALWALDKDYGQDIVYSGPLYRDCTTDGSNVRIQFDCIGGGLKARDGGPLQRFEIAGRDNVWHWAQAKIDGTSVVVHSNDVADPVSVRYAWAANPEGANLVNAEGLPASVFRTK